MLYYTTLINTEVNNQGVVYWFLVLISGCVVSKGRKEDLKTILKQNKFDFAMKRTDSSHKMFFYFVNYIFTNKKTVGRVGVPISKGCVALPAI